MDIRKDKELKEFSKKIKKKFPDAKILLFGSRARGDNLKKSDYDIIVISNAFRKIKMPNRFGMVYEFWDGKYRADIIPYTPEEFRKFSKGLTIAAKAKKEGIYL